MQLFRLSLIMKRSIYFSNIVMYLVIYAHYLSASTYRELRIWLGTTSSFTFAKCRDTEYRKQGVCVCVCVCEWIIHMLCVHV